MKGRILGILHFGLEDCETMRMVSSYRFSRIEHGGPLRMVAARLRSATEDCETIRLFS